MHVSQEDLPLGGGVGGMGGYHGYEGFTSSAGKPFTGKAGWICTASWRRLGETSSRA